MDQLHLQTLQQHHLPTWGHNVIKFDKPKNLNGSDLIAELNAAGVAISRNPFLDENGDLFLDVAESDKAKAATVVAAHNGNMIPNEPTIEHKLSSVGLSVSDLKAALGL